jgi:hypothetical protein
MITLVDIDIMREDGFLPTTFVTFRDDTGAVVTGHLIGNESFDDQGIHVHVGDVIDFFAYDEITGFSAAEPDEDSAIGACHAASEKEITRLHGKGDEITALYEDEREKLAAANDDISAKNVELAESRKTRLPTLVILCSNGVVTL